MISLYWRLAQMNIVQFCVKIWSIFQISLLLMACTKDVVSNLPSETSPRVAAQANVKLAMALLSQGYIKEAKGKLILAKQIDQHEPSVWYGMGFFNEITGEMDQAQKNYEHAIYIAPKNGAAHNNYGVFLCHKGEYQQSIKEFLLAIADPAYLDVGEAYENAGLCALRIPNNHLAIQYFKKAIKQDSSSKLARWYLHKLSGMNEL
jgi:type IV pilus assembly protein PilF